MKRKLAEYQVINESNKLIEESDKLIEALSHINYSLIDTSFSGKVINHMLDPNPATSKKNSLYDAYSFYLCRNFADIVNMNHHRDSSDLALLLFNTEINAIYPRPNSVEFNEEIIPGPILGSVDTYIEGRTRKDHILSEKITTQDTTATEDKKKIILDLFKMYSTIRIAGLIIEDKTLTENQKYFMESADFKVDLAAKYIAALFNARPKPPTYEYIHTDTIRVSINLPTPHFFTHNEFEQFIGGLKQRDSLACKKAISSHMDAMKTSPLASLLPAVLGIPKWDKTFLETLTDAEGNNITIDKYMTKDGELDEYFIKTTLGRELDKRELKQLSKYIKILLKDGERSTELFLNDVLYSTQSQENDLKPILTKLETTSQEESKPTTVLKTLLNDPRICFSGVNRKAIESSITAITFSAKESIRQEEAVPTGRSWAVRSSSSAAIDESGRGR